MKNLKLLFALIGVLTLAFTMIACPTPDDETPVPTDTSKALKKIEVTNQPTKTVYTVGETFSRTGMVVTATYNDGRDAVIPNTGTGSYTVDPSGALAKTHTQITISYTEDGITKTATVSITVKERFTVTPPAEGSRYVFVGAGNILEGEAYNFTVTVAQGFTGTPAFTYTIGSGAPVNASPASSNDGVFTYQIPSVTGNITFSAITGITRSPPAGEAISTAAQFIEIFYTNYDTNRTKSYYLANDIDFQDAELGHRFTGDDYVSWRASNSNAFTGVLDGQGYALKNFSITMTESVITNIDEEGNVTVNNGSADAGLFPQLGLSTSNQAEVEAGRNGTVRNLKILGATMTAFQRSGIIAGVSLGLIENCYIEAELTITGVQAWESGGIVAGENGHDNAAIGLIRNNVVNATANAKVGGITGFMKGTGSTQGGDNIRENFIVTDNLVVKSYTGATAQPAQPTNKLFEMSEIGTVNFSALDTDFWTLTPGSLPALKVLD